MSASQIQMQISLISSQAAQIFGREAFKHVVWVGVFGSFSQGKQGKNVDVVIFYNPKYSEEQI